jgi:hypothetical protein
LGETQQDPIFKTFRIAVANRSKDALDMIKELFQLRWVGRDEYENVQHAYDDYTTQSKLEALKETGQMSCLIKAGSRGARAGPRQTQSFLLTIIDSVRHNLCRNEFETNYYTVHKNIRNKSLHC